MALTDRASLLREYFRLVDSGSTDDALTEHDDATLEGAYLDLQGGYEDAQLFLIEQGLEELWVKEHTISSILGADPNRYAELPSDFLKLDGDFTRSALWTDNGIKWGKLIGSGRRRGASGNVYYLRGNEGASGKEGEKRLYFGRGAAIPSTLYADYVYRVGTLVDSTTVDFPVEDRSLIAAFAAVRGMAHAWFTGDGEDKAEIRDNLKEKKGAASRRARLSRQPKMVDPYPVIGHRWMI